MTNEKAPERIIVCTDGHKPAIADWAKDKMRECDIEYVRADLATTASAAPVVDNERSLSEYVLGFCPEKGRGNAILSVEGELTLLGKQLVRGLVRRAAFNGGKFPDPRHWEPVPAAAATAPVEQSEHDSCSHWREGDSDNCLLCGDDLGPTTEADVSGPAASSSTSARAAAEEITDRYHTLSDDTAVRTGQITSIIERHREGAH